MPLRLYDPYKSNSRYRELNNGIYWDTWNGDPRITLTLALVLIITAALAGGAVHLSRSVKAKREAANTLPPAITLIDEHGTRTVLSLDAPPPTPK